MKTILTSIFAGALLAALTTAQPHYTVTDLGPTDNPFSQATFVSNSGLVTGFDTTSGGASHAVLWRNGLIDDIGTPGLGGPNSGAGGANDSGQVIGGAETSSIDPNHEKLLRLRNRPPMPAVPVAKRRDDCAPAAGRLQRRLRRHQQSGRSGRVCRK